MKEELMRRISAAFDTPDGLSGDPALQQTLRADPEAAKYAKDLARVNKWLAVWPLPEPDDAAYEALASRIEQRFDESLKTALDPTSPPVFDDDDALRDSTASLLQPGEPTGEFAAIRSGEYQISDSQIELITDPGLMEAPSAELKPISPIAKVTLNKARVPQIVEEVSSEHASGEPKSAADLERRLLAPGDPDRPKKKKKKSEASSPGAVVALKPAARAAKDDRISIPTPQPLLGGSLSPVVQLPRREERKPAATFWWFAAAAAVGLGAFGAATFYEGGAQPTTMMATVAATATVYPQTVAVAPAPVATVSPATPPAIALPSDAVARLDSADGMGAEPIETARTAQRSRSLEAIAPAPSLAPMRGPSLAHAGAGGADDTSPGGGLGARAGAGASAHVSSGAPSAAAPPAPAPRATTPPPATIAATPDPSSAHPLAPRPPSELPGTPDRDTIQAVLAGRLEAVRACAEGAHGLADVDVVIASSGRITTATVNGPFAGTPVGSCIARAVRGAQFPPFAQPRFEVTYPYHL